MACIKYHQDTDELKDVCGHGHITFIEYISNPLHPAYPKIPICVMPTCNKYDHKFVWKQYQKAKNLFKEYITPNTKLHLNGTSSDGDVRRHKNYWETSISTSGSRFYPVPREDGFFLTAVMILDADGGGYTLEDLCDEDFIHDVKKLTNLLLHASRTIMGGPRGVFFHSRG